MPARGAAGSTFTHEILPLFKDRGVTTDDSDVCSALLTWMDSDISQNCFGTPVVEVITLDGGTARVKFTQPYQDPSQPELKLRGKWEPAHTYFDSSDYCLHAEFYAETRWA